MYNLGEHFINKNKDDLIADSKAIIKGKKYRITVLTERLMRLEYSEKGEFVDLETSIIKNRRFPVPDFKKNENDKILMIETRYFSLYYTKEMPFSSHSLYAKVGEKKIIWYYGQKEVKNMRGTSASLDGMTSLPSLNNGLFSLDGYATINDFGSILFDENSNFIGTNKNNDIYLFIYDINFKMALNDYFQLTGYPPLIPRYALGNWWSKEYAYNEESVLKLVNKFRKRDIPLSVLVLDNGWSVTNSKYPKATGFTFDSNLYSNPSSFISKIHNQGLKLGVKINPGLGIYPYEPYFEAASKYMKVNKDGYIDFNIYNLRDVDVLLKYFLHPLENMGVDFFWNDYNPHDKYKMYLMNYYLNKDNLRLNKRSMMLSRNSTFASHTNNILYSGRIPIEWKTLAILPFYNLTNANIGVSFWSHDIGGSVGGIEDNDLYLRSVQLGVFSPILRFNTEKGKYFKREPWKWDLVTNSIASDYLRLRHRLIPYLYSEAYKYFKDGQVLVEPFYYQDIKYYDDENYVNQYYFGSAFMISPIIKPMDAIINRTIQRLYIPNGVWYDFKTGKRFLGNHKYLAFYPLEDYPIFVKQGSIIPMAGENSFMKVDNPKDLEIHVFPGESNTYHLYEDDGETFEYLGGKKCITEIDYNYRASNYTIIIRKIEGDLSVIPETRDYKIVFRNTKQADNVIVYENETVINNVETETTETDFIVFIRNIKTSSQLTINCYGKDIEIDSLKLIKDDIDSILYDLKINTVIKSDIADIVFNENLALNKKRIAIKKLKKKGLDPRSIKVFLRLLDYMEM